MKTEKDRIDAEYKSAKARCDGLKGNAKDVCMAEAKGAKRSPRPSSRRATRTRPRPTRTSQRGQG